MKQSESVSSKVSRTLQTNVPSKETRAIGWADFQAGQSRAIGCAFQFMKAHKGKGGGKKVEDSPQLLPPLLSEIPERNGRDIIMEMEECEKKIMIIKKKKEQLEKDKDALERSRVGIKSNIDGLREEIGHLMMQREQILKSINELSEQCSKKKKESEAFFYHQLDKKS